jgi:peptide/nickel transport system substrate-binding protein
MSGSWLAALLVVGVGCSGGNGSSGTGTGGGPGGRDGGEAGGGTRDTLVIGWQSDIGNLNPVVSETASDSNVIEALSFNTLYTDFDCSLKKEPGLAKSWEWSEDGTVLKMELRDDIKWEDGTPVTADDVAFTYELVADPAVASARFNHVERLKPDGRPKIVDATHVEWHFTQAYDRDTQASHVALNLVPKHVFGGLDRSTLRGNEKSNQPLSYGPWRLAKWEPQSRVVLEPNPTFSGPAEFKPRLNRVIFRVIPDYATRVIELENGGIDLMESLLVADADRIRADHPEIQLVRRGWRSMDYIAWNLSDPLFQDRNVRKALAMATNTDDMMRKLLTSKTGERYARPAIGTITPALCGVHNDEVAPLPYALDEAKALLEAAGWKDTDGDKVLDNNGKKFEFTLSTNTGNKRRADAAVLFQDQMKQLGVVVNLEKTESNTFFENLRKKQYQTALAGWSAALFVDPSSMWHCDTEGKKYEFNFTGYCNPEVDRLIDQGLSTPDPKLATPMWKEMQAKIYEDQPYLFLWWMDEIVGVHERFQNTKIDVLSSMHDLHQWEVPADKVKYKR